MGAKESNSQSIDGRWINTSVELGVPKFQGKRITDTALTLARGMAVISW
jgi:hypothetical protein